MYWFEVVVFETVYKTIFVPEVVLRMAKKKMEMGVRDWFLLMEQKQN